MLEPKSFDIWRKAEILIIVILSCLKVDIEVLNVSIKIIEFSKCKVLLEIDRVTNEILAITYSRTWFFYKDK